MTLESYLGLIRIIRPLSISLTIYHLSMVYCVVVGCKNGTNKDNPFTGSFNGFHQSRDYDVSGQLARIFRASYRWKPHNQICSDHFHPDDFIISHQRGQDLGVNPGRFQLKPGRGQPVPFAPPHAAPPQLLQCWHCHYSQQARSQGPSLRFCSTL